MLIEILFASTIINSEDFKIKPVIRAILEMVDEINQPGIITD